jgi:hypothetical protein
MPVAGRDADGAEHCRAILFNNAAHGLLPADLAHLAMPFARGIGHERLDA